MSDQLNLPLPKTDIPLRSEATVARDTGASSGEGQAEGPASPLLYLASLGVTLSALYAVNFSLNDPNFASMTYGLAILGYVISFFLRVRRISLQALHVPILVCLALVVLAGISSDRGLGWLGPADMADDRSKNLQLILLWMTIFLSFRLASDAIVLFECVPCIAMIALVSTTTTEPEIQNAFVSLVACATFLIVHENYLRTRMATVLGRTSVREGRLFRGQLQLAAFCVISALVLANVVAVPIHSFGQALALPGLPGSMARSAARNSQQNNVTVAVGEKDTLDVGNGPVTESDTPLLRVRSERGLYWRGTTYDYYTGHGFQNYLGAGRSLDPKPDSEEIARREREYDTFTVPEPGAPRSTLFYFQIPRSQYELPSSDMLNSTVCKQDILPMNGLFSQLYGAATIEEVRAPLTHLSLNPAGSLASFLAGGVPRAPYQVISRVADEDPDDLRKASSARSQIPADIANTYLQIGPESATLRDLVHSIIHGLTNNYDKAEALRSYIAKTCKYNLQAPAIPRDHDVVTSFLFESRQGYCDSFAASLTMLCRYAGIPARLASGFLTGELNRDGFYVVRERDKHVWTEVFFPHIGWVPFDATDGAEDISNHNLNAKTKGAGFLAWVRSQGPIIPIVGLVLLALLGYLVKTELWDRFAPRRRLAARPLALPAANMEIIAAYMTACTALARRGMARPASMTPDEFVRYAADRSAASLPDLLEPLERLTALCTRFRYSPETATAEDVRAAKEATAQIAVALSRAGRGAFALTPSRAPA